MKILIILIMKKRSFLKKLSSINENNPSTAEDEAELARITQVRGI